MTHRVIRYKDGITGVIDRQKQPVTGNAFRPYISWVVECSWEDLQAYPYAPLTPSTAPTMTGASGGAPTYGVTLSTALANARTAGLPIRLRPKAGVWAPDWVKSLNGTPLNWVTTTDTGYGTSFTIGRWWKSAYLEAYRDFMMKLAHLYDNDPIVQSVQIVGAQTIYEEPFIHQTSDNKTTMLTTDYTAAAEQAAYYAAIDIHKKYWLRTPSCLAISTWDHINPSAPHTFNDTTTPKAVATYGRNVLGSLFTPGNHAIVDPATGTGAGNNSYYAGDIYPHLQSLGSPLYFQTDIPARLGNLAGTINYAISLGARSLELPSGYNGSGVNSITTTQAQSYNATMAAIPRW